MRNYILIPLLFLCSFAFSQEGTDKKIIFDWWSSSGGEVESEYEAYLIIGESIMGHTSSNSTLGPTTLAGTCYRWISNGLTELTTQDLNKAGASFGTPWKQFALNRNARTGKKIVLINHAFSGSEFYPDGDTNNWSASPSGVNYDIAVNDGNACLAFIEKDKFDGIFIGLGANDVVSANSLANITTAMQSFFTRIQASFPNTQIYVASNGYVGTELLTSRIFTVKNNFKDIANANANVTLVANFMNMRPWSFYLGDITHLNQNGNNQLGAMFDRAIANTESNKQVRQVLNCFHTELSAAHSSAIKTAIESLQSSGYFDLTDELFLFVKTVRQNVFISIKNTTGGIDVNFTFNANDNIVTNTSQTFNTNWIPSVSAIASSLNDMLVMFKTDVNLTPAGTGAYAFGVQSTGTGLRILQASNSTLSYSCNNATLSNYTGHTKFNDNTWYGVSRDVTNQYLSVNGTTVQTAAVAAVSLPTAPVIVGALTANTSPINCGFKAMIFTRKSGINEATYQGIIDTLITALEN